MYEIILLFAAGFFGGILNSLAGGGSFITFPALLSVGVPPIIAGATNTYASMSGYISGAFAYRHDMIRYRKELPKYIGFALIGGAMGAWLLLQTPPTVFEEVIPWLMLFATVLFIFGGKINKRLMGAGNGERTFISSALIILFLLAINTYGGFFNAGQGILFLAYLVLAGYTNINSMNGLKLVVSSCVAIIAVVLFAVQGAIAWYEGSVMLLGTLTGGYVAARIARKLPDKYVRTFVTLMCIVITAYFFFDVYYRS
ncbi:sulfite exporter TauE/SafE family protein [Kordiimonas sp. SCSIO 12603]|uniref:sulfite exporter TauE/SafE family protein n=1 Tax=Kordiimonas sp. SCSIO 12603 TaxID=2829596 RepID=UPI002106F119|nr:sulfite exporter TauE/SafE family protein [Kordiimonas sp. SCSIO 12603]UTW60263.1 sulfite exporter TauE/SafE family protein [Kordiimonas sp. SCSIO 12603]